MSKRKICIISSSRADYNHLFPIMSEIKSSKELDLQVVVTGMHLQKNYGYTYKEILKDGFKIDKKISDLVRTKNNYLDKEIKGN